MNHLKNKENVIRWAKVGAVRCASLWTPPHFRVHLCSLLSERKPVNLESILNVLNKDGPQGMRSAPPPVVGCSKGTHKHLPPGNARWWGQALAQGRKKETITMTSERERGSERRRTKGRERGDDHNVVRSLELRDATAGWFCFSMLGWQMTSGLTCDMLSWEMKKGGLKGDFLLSTPSPTHK